MFKLKVKEFEEVSHEFKIIKHRLALFTQQSMREVICMKVLGPRHALLAITDIQVFCFKIYECAGNFVEEVEPELKELETGSGNEGASHWSIVGWVGVCTCIIVLTCVVGYFKKSIE